MEEVKTEEKQVKVDKKGSHKFKLGKGLARVLTGTGLVVLLGLGTVHMAYNYVPNNADSLKAVTNGNDDSSIHYIMRESDMKEVANVVYALETDMQTEEDLADLKLDKIAEGKLDSSTYTDKEIRLFIEEFEELEKVVDKKTPNADTLRYYELAEILYNYQKSNSEVVSESELAAINTFAETYVKSVIIDSLGFDREEIDNITVNFADAEEVILYTDPVTGKTFDLNISQFNNINSLISDVRKLNTMMASVKENGCDEKTEEKIIKLEAKILDELKLVQQYDYEIKDGNIKQSQGVFKSLMIKF